MDIASGVKMKLVLKCLLSVVFEMQGMAPKVAEKSGIIKRGGRMRLLLS